MKEIVKAKIRKMKNSEMFPVPKSKKTKIPEAIPIIRPFATSAIVNKKTLSIFLFPPCSLASACFVDCIAPFCLLAGFLLGKYIINSALIKAASAAFYCFYAHVLRKFHIAGAAFRALVHLQVIKSEVYKFVV